MVVGLHYLAAHPTKLVDLSALVSICVQKKKEARRGGDVELIVAHKKQQLIKTNEKHNNVHVKHTEQNSF